MFLPCGALRARIQFLCIPPFLSMYSFALVIMKASAAKEHPPTLSLEDSCEQRPCKPQGRAVGKRQEDV